MNFPGKIIEYYLLEIVSKITLYISIRNIIHTIRFTVENIVQFI